MSRYRERYYNYKVYSTKAQYQARMADIMDEEAANESDPVKYKRLRARMYAHRRLARKYDAMAYAERGY